MVHPIKLAAIEAEPTTALERAQLHRTADENAERAVLAALLRDAVDEVSPLLEPRSFYWPAHAAIFRCAVSLHDGKQPIDEQTIGSMLDRAGTLEKFGGMEFLMSLRMATPDVGHARAHAKIVADLFAQRRVVEAAMQIVTEGLAGRDDPQAFVNRADTRMRAAIERTKDTKLIGMREVVRARCAAWNRMEVSGYEGGLLTGLVALDRRTDGLAMPGFSMIAAETGAGKTVIGWAIALHVAGCIGADKRRQAVVYVSGEVDEKKLHDRAVCAIAGITLRLLRRVMMSAPDWRGEEPLTRDERARVRREVEEAQRWLEAAPIYIYPRIASIDDIRAAIRDAKRQIAEETPEGEEPARIVLLEADYIQMMRLVKADRHDLALSIFAEGLATIANEEQLAALALAQANQGAKKREGGAFSNLDLKNSSSMADPASLVAFLERRVLAMGKEDAEKRKKWTNYAEIHITKGREHSHGAIPLFFDGARSVVRDPTPGEFAHLTDTADDF